MFCYYFCFLIYHCWLFQQGSNIHSGSVSHCLRNKASSRSTRLFTSHGADCTDSLRALAAFKKLDSVPRRRAKRRSRCRLWNFDTLPLPPPCDRCSGFPNFTQKV